MSPRLLLSDILFISIISGIDSVSLEPILNSAIDSLRILSDSITDKAIKAKSDETDLSGENEGRQFNNPQGVNQNNHNDGYDNTNVRINGFRIHESDGHHNDGSQSHNHIAVAGGLGLKALLSLFGVGKLAAFCIAVVIGGIILVGSLIAGAFTFGLPDDSPTQFAQPPQFQPQFGSFEFDDRVHQYQSRFSNAQEQYHNI